MISTLIRFPKYSTALLNFLLLVSFPLVSQQLELQNLLLSEYEKGQLNGSVLVMKNDKALLERSYGVTDSSQNTKLTKDYRFNLGSVFKEFPGVAIMQLKEQGKLELEDYISQYLTNLPEWSTKIQISHLLQYSSGLPKAPWGKLFSENSKVREHDLMNEISSIDSLAFKPGSSYLYSTLNPVLLIKIVEKISGKKFSKYAEEHLLGRTGMESTIFKPEYPYSDRTKMALPINAEFKEDKYGIAIDFVLLSSTPGDIYKWFHQLESFEIISKSSLLKLSEEFPDLPEINTQSTLGHLKWNKDIIESHLHHGNSNNYECIIKSYPQEELTIVILTNREAGDIHKLSDQIYKIVSAY